MPPSPDDLLAHILDETKAMSRMRDKLIHHYFGVDYALVWDTVVSDIPKMRLALLAIRL